MNGELKGKTLTEEEEEEKKGLALPWESLKEVFENKPKTPILLLI